MPISHSDILSLRKERAKLWVATGEDVIVIKDPSTTEAARGEARVRFDKADTEIEILTKKIETAEAEVEDDQRQSDADGERLDRYGRLKKMLGESAGRVIEQVEEPGAVSSQGVGYHAAFISVLKHGPAWCRDHDPDSLEALYAQRQDLTKLSQDHPEVAAVVSAGVDSTLGYLVPQEPVQKHVEAKKFNGGLLQTDLTTLPTTHGREIPWTLEDETGEEGEYISERHSHDGGTLPKVRKLFFRAHTLSSKIVRVPVQLIQDLSDQQFETYIFSRFGKRISRRRNRALIQDDGSEKPTGLMKSLPVKYETPGGQTNTLTYLDFLRLEEQLDVVHRPGAEMLFNPSILTALKMETDNENRPLWQPSVAVGQPNTYNNYPYHLDSYMPPLGAGNVTIAMGQFEAYVYRTVTSSFLVTFRERFMDDGEVGYLMFVRHDGKLVDAGDNPLIGLKMADA